MYNGAQNLNALIVMHDCCVTLNGFTQSWFKKDEVYTLRHQEIPQVNRFIKMVNTPCHSFLLLQLDKIFKAVRAKKEPTNKNKGEGNQADQEHPSTQQKAYAEYYDERQEGSHDSCFIHPTALEKNQSCQVDHIPLFAPTTKHPIQIVHNKRVAVACKEVVRSMLKFLCAHPQCIIPTHLLLLSGVFLHQSIYRGGLLGDRLMATQLIREWTGIQQFPPATQSKLLELLGKLKQENVSTLTILVMGKGGVGKSSTVNSILGERVAAVSAFQTEGLRPIICSRSRAGFTLNVIDTPGLVEGGYINEHALEIIKRFLLNRTIDVLLYVDRLDAYRVDNLDRQVIKAITDSFGKGIWHRAIIVLTHAQLSPPDGLNYDDFFTRRSEALLKVVRLGARIKKQELQDPPMPIALVENSGRCNVNESGEKVLPNGTVWIPDLVKMIAEVISNGSKAIVVDKKLIEGPNPNDRGKFFIPLILAFQYFFVVKNIQKKIKEDIAMEPRPDWELRDM